MKMKIYVNENYEICALYHTDRLDLAEIEVDRAHLGGWCDTALLGFQYAPSYEIVFNDDGTIATDEEGNTVYRMDENGNKIQQGWCFSPAIDFNIIQAIQNLHDHDLMEMKQENEELTLAMADVLGGAL